MRLHSSINITGTHWTRQSSSNPNQQNFKKGLSYLFGPPPNYYWLYFDIVNIELRIWAYEVGSRQLIEAFEQGESVHMIIARALRQHQIDRAGGETKWKDTDHIHHQYTDTKGGTFTRIYGGGVKKANDTYGIENACAVIDKKIPEVGRYFKQLQEQMLLNETKYGYPSIFTTQGYRLEVPVTKPYSVPSARIQGTASIIVQDMMIEIVKTPIYQWGPDASTHSTLTPNKPFCNLIQQVHDSLTFEIPIHETSEVTNNTIHKHLEKIGQKHIPTCPLEKKIIHYTEDENILYRMYAYLPETINEYTITYYHDGTNWIAEAIYEESILTFKHPNYKLLTELVRANLEVPF